MAERENLLSPGSSAPRYATGPVIDEEPETVHLLNNQPAPNIICRFCRQTISLKGQLRRKSIIQCRNGSCKALIPIKQADAGHMYVRCPCRMLMTCRTSALKIRCSRATCKKKITLRNLELDVNGGKFECVYCNQDFVMLNVQKFGRCSFCGRLSSLEKNYAFCRALFFFILSVMFAGGTVTTALLTYKMAWTNWPFYVIWTAGGLIAIAFFLVFISYTSIKTSNRVISINEG